MIEGLSSMSRSVSFRLAVTYSVLVFGLAALVVSATYVASDGGVALLVALGAMFPASVAIGWLLTDRLLRPLRAITDAAEDLGRRSDPSGRIRLEGPDDELTQVADTIDSLLDRVEAGVEERWAFVQDISHELRNPLAVMATTLDVALADDDADAAELRRSAEIVRRTIDRAARSVDDLIIFARNETPESKRTRVDFSGLLREVLADHRGPMESRRLTVELVRDPAVVTGDRDALKRAVDNIVGNAVRLSRAGSLLRAGTGSHLGFSWIAIDDQGPGLDPRQHDDVFRRFWSHDRASLNGEERTGLGLAISRQIAEQHGGLVTLRSELGAGAEFAIWIPASPEADVGAIAPDGIHPAWSPLQEPTKSFIPA